MPEQPRRDRAGAGGRQRVVVEMTGEGPTEDFIRPCNGSEPSIDQPDPDHEAEHERQHCCNRGEHPEPLVSPVVQARLDSLLRADHEPSASRLAGGRPRTRSEPGCTDSGSNEGRRPHEPAAEPLQPRNQHHVERQRQREQSTVAYEHSPEDRHRYRLEGSAQDLLQPRPGPSRRPERIGGVDTERCQPVLAPHVADRSRASLIRSDLIHERVLEAAVGPAAHRFERCVDKYRKFLGDDLPMPAQNQHPASREEAALTGRLVGDVQFLANRRLVPLPQCVTPGFELCQPRQLLDARWVSDRERPATAPRIASKATSGVGSRSREVTMSTMLLTASIRPHIQSLARHFSEMNAEKLARSPPASFNRGASTSLPVRRIGGSNRGPS